LLKPTPSSPQRPLTANGIASTRRMTTATGSPARSAPGAAYGSRQTTSAATIRSAARPRLTLVPCPGARASTPVTPSTAASPTPGSSQDQECRPASDNRARPTSSEAAQISAAEA
jgi:hypothetical protein